MPDTDVPLLRLAREVAQLRFEDIPQTIREHGTRVLADTIGVIFGGARRPEIERLVEGQSSLFPSIAAGASHILTPSMQRADPTLAAVVNATAGTFLELDEGYRPTGHPAMHVVPAALAAAEACRSSGQELLVAVLAGYEITARLFEAYRLTYPLHPHGHFGAVGAAVAVGMLSGADVVEPAAIASTLPLLSTWQPCLEGATARNAYTGMASGIGLFANRLASAGFTGSREAQQVAFGGLVGELVAPDVLEEPIDARSLRITRNYMKLHSACALTHSALDAVLTLAPFRIDEVERVEVETVQNNMKIAGQARTNDLSTRFSIPYAVAAAMVHGHTRPEAFIPHEQVAELARRVEVRVAEDLEASWPSAMPARVAIHYRDGIQRARSDNPHGHHANPASPRELQEKFESLVNQPDAARLYARLRHIDRIDDMSQLFPGPL